MRKIVAGLFISLDGVIDSPHEWHFDEWQNSTLISGDVNAELAALKAQPGKDIGISGSGHLVRTLLRDGLLDELHLLVHPVVVGKGTRLFPDGFDKIGLQLTDSQPLPHGVLHLTYQLAPAQGENASA